MTFRAGWSGGRGKVLPFVDFSVATFSRTAEASMLLGPSSSGIFMQTAAPMAPRYENRGDGAGNLLLIEEARTSFNARSRAFQASSWAAHGSSSITSAYVAGPDGNFFANRIQAPNDANSWRQNINVQHPTTAPICFSVYVRSAIGGSGSAAGYLYTGGSVATEKAFGVLATTSTWTRYDMVVPTYAAECAIFIGDNTNLTSISGVAAGARDAVYDFTQTELGTYPTSPIRQSGIGGTLGMTRDADVMTAVTFSNSLFTVPGQFTQFSPIFSSAEVTSGSSGWLFTIDDVNNGVRWRHNGTNVVIEAVQSGSVKATSNALTFSRHALLGAVSWNPSAGTVSVSGTAGSAGTPWTWSGSKVRIGGIYSGSGEVNGRLGAFGPTGIQPYVLSTTSSLDVMWIGDSITAAGTSTIAQWRYSVQLAANARNEKQFYNAVGPLQSSAIAFAQDYSLSTNGWVVASVTASMTTNNMTAPYSTEIQPHIIPILIGTNDIGVLSASNATLYTSMQSLVTNLATVYPKSLLVIQQIFPRLDSFAAQVTDWNTNYWPTLVSWSQTQGYKSIGDSTFANMTGISYLDSVHPISSSADRIGRVYMEPAMRNWKAQL